MSLVIEIVDGRDQMADIFSLRLIGLAFAIVTLAVTATAAVVANVEAEEGPGAPTIHVAK
jgi:hypothetical protein